MSELCSCALVGAWEIGRAMRHLFIQVDQTQAPFKKASFLEDEKDGHSRKGSRFQKSHGSERVRPDPEHHKVDSLEPTAVKIIPNRLVWFTHKTAL